MATIETTEGDLPTEKCDARERFRIDSAWHLAREVREHVNKILGLMENRERAPTRQPVDYDRSQEDFNRLMDALDAAIRSRSPGPGGIHTNGVKNWLLGVFAAIISLLLGFILNAQYATNGEVGELKGEVRALQTQVTNLIAGRSGVDRGVR